MLRRPALLMLVACAALGAAACSSSDGRTLPPPTSGHTTTPVSSPVVGQPSDVDEDDAVTEVFALFSSAFENNTPIPAIYSCTGADVSPPLDWASAPPAAELAIVVRDLDAVGYVHWVVTGIDPLITSLGEDGLPEGAVEAMNDKGTIGWAGPCPPPGATHTYAFTIHALAEPLVIEPGAPATEAAQLVEGSSAAQAVLLGTFRR